MTVPPPSLGWPSYLVGIALETVVFVAVGPLVGTIAFLLMLVILSSPGTIAMTVVGFPYVFVLGHLLAWKAAVVTGIVAGAATPYLSESKYLYAMTVLAGIVASLVVVPLRFGLVGGPVALAGAGAAAVCTRLGLGLWRWRGAGASVSG